MTPFFGTELDFEKPVWFGDHPTIKNKYVIVEKSRALVSLVGKNKSGEEKKSHFLKIPEEVYVTSDEGLLGFTFHPQFKENRRYFFMHEVRDNNYRGMVIGERIASEDYTKDSGKPTKKILEFEVATEFHHGGGIEFGPDGYLYIGMGDGGPQEDPLGNAQNLHSFSGKLLRIDVDKNTNDKLYSIPKDNPFILDEEYYPKIFTYGHRNQQGLVKNIDGVIFSHEHGPKGGDELNIIIPGLNYGWPAITYGIDYNGSIISPFKKKDGMEQPIKYWTPSIALSDMTFYYGDKFPEWYGNLFISALSSKDVRRLNIKNNKVISEEIMFKEVKSRIRSIKSSKNGNLIILTDGRGKKNSGKLIRVLPK